MALRRQPLQPSEEVAKARVARAPSPAWSKDLRNPNKRRLNPILASGPWPQALKADLQ
jgi:hypothetical protein